MEWPSVSRNFLALLYTPAAADASLALRAPHADPRTPRPSRVRLPVQQRLAQRLGSHALRQRLLQLVRGEGQIFRSLRREPSRLKRLVAHRLQIRALDDARRGVLEP